MRRFVTAALALAMLAGSPALAASGSRDFSVGSFDKLDAAGAWTIELRAGTGTRLRVRAEDQRDLALVDAKVSFGTLKLGLKRGASPRGDLHAEVSAGRLERIALAGASRLRGRGFNGGKLGLAIDGAGKVTLEGRVSDLDVEINGAGGLEADKLRAERVVLDLNGACKALVHAVSKLKVDASGMCAVEYVGDPELETKGSWTSSVRKRR